MRLFFCSIAPFVLVLLAFSCNTVDPSECWVNTSGGIGDDGTIPIGAGVGASTTGDFAVPPPGGPLDYGGTPNPCVTPPSPGGSGTPPSPGSADPFAGIDPQVLAKATLKASAFAYYMDGMLSSTMVDLSDPAAFATAFEQGAPMAEMAVDAWLPTLDPSTITTAGHESRYDCTEKYGCPYSGKCINPGPWSSESTTCWVNDCGSAKCTACPWFFPEMLTASVIKSWCSYVCTGPQYPPNVVAQGAVVIVKKTGQPFPANNFVWCVKP